MALSDVDAYHGLMRAAQEGRPFVDGRGVPASAVREVLVGRLPTSLQLRPRRLVIASTRIVGDLDLHGAALTTKLSLHNCDVDGLISLLDATLPGLAIDGGSVHWLDAANTVTEMELWLKHAMFRYGVDLTDAIVGGSVHLEGSTFGPGTRPPGEDSSPSGCPVRLNRVTIKGSLIALGITCHGMMDLSNARIGADIELDGATVSAPDGTPETVAPSAIHAPNIYVGGSITADPDRLRTRRTINHAGLGSTDARVGLVPVQRSSQKESSRSEEPATAGGPTPYGPLAVIGRLYLADARIGADLDLTGARLTVGPQPPDAGASADPIGPTVDAQNDANAVLVLDRADIDGNVRMDQRFTAEGLIRMVNAKVHGDLRFNGSTLTGRAAATGSRTYSVLADAVEIDGQVDGSGARVTGEVRLRDARVGHNMYLRDTVILEPGGNALHLERAEVGGMLVCTRLHARGSLRLLDLRCGPVVLDGAHLSDPCTAENSSPTDTADEQHDPVLDLSGAQITGFVEARAARENGTGAPATRAFVADGAAHLRETRVSRAVVFSGARLRSAAPYTFDAAGLVATDLSLDGARVIGPVRIADARISGDLDMSGATLGERDPVEDPQHVDRPPALFARAWAYLHRARRPDPTRIVRKPPMSLDGTSATIGGVARFDRMYAQHTLSLRRATIVDTVDMQSVTLADRRFALDLAGLHVPDIRLSPANRLIGRVDMARLVTITLMDNDNLWTPEEIDVWGIEFGILIDADSATRTHDLDPLRRVLRRLDRTRFLLPPYYDRLEREVIAPRDPLLQPYQQLARMYRALGKDGEARKVLYRMRRREWRQLWFTSGAMSKLRWLGGLFYNVTAGFGYRLSRAFYWLLMLWVAGWICFSLSAHDAHPTPTSPPGQTGNMGCTISNDADPVPVQPGYCGTYDPALYSIDLILPVIDLGQASSWHFRAVGPQVAGDFLQIAGWLLASAAATAALNLVGRDGDAQQPTEPRWTPS